MIHASLKLYNKQLNHSTSQQQQQQQQHHIPISPPSLSQNKATTPMPQKFTSFTGTTRPITSDTARPSSSNETPLLSLHTPLSEPVPQLHDACTRVGF
ncbi:putative isopenicillin n [Venturia nashicola]|nr:putative isopenicillin n [Venturia nashicola]